MAAANTSVARKAFSGIVANVSPQAVNNEATAMSSNSTFSTEALNVRRTIYTGGWDG